MFVSLDLAGGCKQAVLAVAQARHEARELSDLEFNWPAGYEARAELAISSTHVMHPAAAAS